MKDIFDKDYFECGIESGKSCYQNYRWIPELTIPMAMTMIDYLGIAPGDTILDFGCAKGFLVKAMRWLNRECYGHDISKYALEHCDPEVKSFCYNGSCPVGTQFDFCIAKDVFEHIPLDDLKCVLKKGLAKKYFVIVPFGENGKFRAPNNNMDVTHVNCMDEQEWMHFFWYKADMNIVGFTHRIKGIKDSYYEKYPRAHGFFTLCY